MNETMWFLVVVVVTWLFGRLAKLWPAVPKGLLPWLVLGVGYGVGFSLALQRGEGVAQAAQVAFAGLAAGLVAVGGHEALKPLLVRFLGEELARKILGKLPPVLDPVDKKKD